MDAVLVIDKPLHLTSFDVVARLRRLLGERRIGHAGTLDPLATGVLVLCLGEATKLVPYLMDADKEYLATARLGITTDTDDADPRGRVLSRAPQSALFDLREATIRAALARFVGSPRQRPPRFSALKLDGQRLYQQARRAQNARPEKPSDEAADRANNLADTELDAQTRADAAIEQATEQKTRTVRIDEITVESLRLWTPDSAPLRSDPESDSELPEVCFRVRCGKGTYIRSLARDLGEALGVGAHLSALRRLRVGRFDVRDAVPPAGAKNAHQHGLAAAVAHLPRILLSDSEATRLRHGQPAVLRELQPRLCEQLATAAPTELPAVAAIDSQGRLLAILAPRQSATDRFCTAPWHIARGFVVSPAPGNENSVENQEPPCTTGCA